MHTIIIPCLLPMPLPLLLLSLAPYCLSHPAGFLRPCPAAALPPPAAPPLEQRAAPPPPPDSWTPRGWAGGQCHPSGHNRMGQGQGVRRAERGYQCAERLGQVMSGRRRSGQGESGVANSSSDGHCSLYLQTRPLEPRMQWPPKSNQEAAGWTSHCTASRAATLDRPADPQTNTACCTLLLQHKRGATSRCHHQPDNQLTHKKSLACCPASRLIHSHRAAPLLLQLLLVAAARVAGGAAWQRQQPLILLRLILWCSNACSCALGPLRLSTQAAGHPCVFEHL